MAREVGMVNWPLPEPNFLALSDAARFVTLQQCVAMLIRLE